MPYLGKIRRTGLIHELCCVLRMLKNFVFTQCVIFERLYGLLLIHTRGKDVVQPKLSREYVFHHMCRVMYISTVAKTIQDVCNGQYFSGKHTINPYVYAEGLEQHFPWRSMQLGRRAFAV